MDETLDARHGGKLLLMSSHDVPRSNVMSSRTTEESGKPDAVVLFDARRLGARVHVHVLFFEKALIHQRDHYPHNPDPLSH